MARKTLADAVKAQFTLYPQMQISDLYKTLYQGVMGSGHAVDSCKKAEIRLKNELLEAGDCIPGEDSFEELPPSGKIVRVNLRPFILSGGDPGVLLKAFVRTSREYRGSTDDLVRSWHVASLAQKAFSLQEMNSFLVGQKLAGFPAIHHSTVYRELYRPAYRVVCKHFIEDAAAFEQE